MHKQAVLGNGKQEKRKDEILDSPDEEFQSRFYLIKRILLGRSHLQRGDCLQLFLSALSNSKFLKSARICVMFTCVCLWILLLTNHHTYPSYLHYYNKIVNVRKTFISQRSILKRSPKVQRDGGNRMAPQYCTISRFCLCLPNLQAATSHLVRRFLNCNIARNLSTLALF